MEIENKNEPQMSEEDFETVEETADRLMDLAMALCYYDPDMAKPALALALGTLCANFEECPCIHEMTEIAEDQHDHILEHKTKDQEKTETTSNN